MNLKLKILLVIFMTISKCECLGNWLCDFLNDTSTNQISEKCSRQISTVCRNSHLSWMMFDASSKYPYTGMSYGNNMDLGNEPECISLKYEDTNGRILGKHCALSVVVFDLFLSADLAKISEKLNISAVNNNNRALESKDIYLDLKKELETLDSNNYVMSLLSWCIPDSCTVKEVGTYFHLANTSLIYYNNDETSCETAETNTSLGTLDIVVTVILATILLLIILSTYYDVLIQQSEKKPKHRIFIAFSVYTNGRKLFKLTEVSPREQVQCFNGMRTISMVWIIAGHAIVAYTSMPIINLPEGEAYEKHWRSQFLASARVAVDTFFFMSGFLLAYNYFKSASNISPVKQVFGIPPLYLYRYLRLTPALLMVLLVNMSIFRFLGSGPLWNSARKIYTGPCEQQWWQVLLYVQNYVNYEKMCLLHTWYLCADMQMFILSPLILIPASVFVKKHFKAVIYTFIGLTIISFIVPIAVRLADHSITNDYDTHSRLSNYLIGITLGTIMRIRIDKPFPFSKRQNFVIWVIVLAIALGVHVVHYVDSSNYEYNTHYIFDSLYRPVWSTCLAWMVYSCHHGHGGIVNGILTLPIFQVGAKLSYCMYLVHISVVMHHIGTIRVPYYFSDYEQFFNWCGYLLVTTIVCIMWTLAFESPMITIEKVLFNNFGKVFRSIIAFIRKDIS